MEFFLKNWFSTHRLSNTIYHINHVKERNVIILTYAKNLQNSAWFYNKNTQQTRNRGKLSENYNVVLESLGPYRQHYRLPCPSPTPGACSHSCPLSQWCHPTTRPLSSPSPPAFSLSHHQALFQWISSLHQVAKILELQLQHQSFNEYSGLLSLRIDWFNPQAVRGTFKNLLQHCSWKASIPQCSAFFISSNSHIHRWLLEKP